MVKKTKPSSQKKVSKDLKMSSIKTHKTSTIPFHACEQALFSALLSTDSILRNKAWEILSEKGAFLTGQAEVLADAILKAFPKTPPTGNPGEWVSQVMPESFQEILIELELQTTIQVDLEVLEDVHNRFRQLREKKTLEHLKNKSGLQDEEVLGEIYQRLKKLKVMAQS